MCLTRSEEKIIISEENIKDLEDFLILNKLSINNGYEIYHRLQESIRKITFPITYENIKSNIEAQSIDVFKTICLLDFMSTHQFDLNYIYELLNCISTKLYSLKIEKNDI